MIKAYHPYPLSADAGALTLDGGESRHLLKSLRVREGEAVDVYDGRGFVRHGNCLSSDQFGLRIAVGRTTHHPRPKVTITLAQVLPKSGLFEDLIRFAIELGASRIIPLTSERCEIKLTGDRADAKAERWNTIAIEALKQSGNPWLIDIAPVQKLSAWLPKALGEKDLGLTGSLEPDAKPITELTPPEGTRSITLLIGPEGDFSDSEYAAARTHGFTPVSFGVNVLRLETAAIYGLVAADLLRRRI